MFAKLHNQFGTAGLIVAIVALIAALGGGAYAANHSGSTAAVSKSTAGPRGPRGKTGPPGPVGPAGANGKDGTNGKDGAPGANGKSIVIGSAPGCEEGGISVEVEESPATKRIVCNGIEGPPGQKGDEGEEGEPGENGQTGFTETLPSGQTETGAWISPAMSEEAREQVAISFPIPLPNALGFEEQHYVTIEEQETHASSICPGTAEAPKAARSNLCIYEGVAEAENEAVEKGLSVLVARRLGFRAPGAATAGAVIYVLYEGPPSTEEAARLSGSWAVTAP
jgi:hypothetical protein